MHRILAVFSLWSLLAGSAAAAGSVAGEVSSGDAADLDAMIAMARRSGPDVAVAALEAEAAAARVAGADSLPDPKLQWQAMDIPRGGDSYLPSQFARTDKIFLQQEFPLWGKRDLKRAIAEADAGRAAALKVVAENELVARVKAAYADYHQVHEAADLDRELLPRLTAVARAASARYAQGSGSQQEAAGAEIERTRMEAELSALTGQRHGFRARLNTLIGRDPGAPIIETPVMRAIPARLDLEELSARAERFNPDLRAEAAGEVSAERSADLADRGWYPDIAVSLGGVKSYGRFSGYEGMLEITLPIRGDLHDSQVAEAKATAGAARARREARRLAVANAMSEAYWALKTARQTAKLTAEGVLPAARLRFESAVHAYEVGRGDFATVLSAEQQWRLAGLDLLKAEFEQQIRLAEIEKLVGGEL